MFALYQAGGLVERLFGSTRFALIYLLSALSGSVASGWWDPLRNSAGASGAIFGVYGALLAFMAVRRVDIPPSMLKSISNSALVFCLYSLVIGAAHPLIDNACHVGGLLGGFVAGAILARPFNIEARAAPQPATTAARRARHRTAADVDGAVAGRRRRTSCRQPSFPPRAHGLRSDRRPSWCASRPTSSRFRPDVRVDRQEIAKRLRDEVLLPWREASKPIAAVVDAFRRMMPEPARLQAAWRDYLLAREHAVALRVLALETGDVSDDEPAPFRRTSAWARP